MPSLLWLLSYVGALAAFLFVTLSLASGLLWLAELIEEHSRYAKYIGMRAIYGVIIIHILLIYTDSLPALHTLFSILAHLIYLSNFTPSWPFISLTSPRFVLSCIMVIADHFIWFFHFANKANEAKRRSPRYSYGANATAKVKGEHSFMEVSAFFGICVWMVPLFLFLSLSANDNALPSTEGSKKLDGSTAVQRNQEAVILVQAGRVCWRSCNLAWQGSRGVVISANTAVSSAPPSPSGAIDLNSPSIHSTNMNGPHQKSRRPVHATSLVKSLLTPIVSLLPRLRRKKRDDEGILAPRTPIRGSPLHTPVNMPGVSSGYFPWGQGSDGGPQSGGSRSHSPVPIHTSLSSSGGSGSGSSSGPGSGFAAVHTLSPDTAKSSFSNSFGRTAPPPPRRVQSEAQVTTGQNPRGLATRNGKVVVPDSMLPPSTSDSSESGFGGGSGTLASSPTSMASGTSYGPPSMSLGPKGLEKLGGAEVLESTGLHKRKGD